MLKRILVFGALCAMASVAAAQDIETPIERDMLVATAIFEVPGKAVVTLGDGGTICGPFKMTADSAGVVIELHVGECIVGTYPDWILPRVGGEAK